MNNKGEEFEKDSNKFILVNNQKIDSLTIKFLNQVWSLSPYFTVIKFFNNDISEEVSLQI